jgi:hypothetical protein
MNKLLTKKNVFFLGLGSLSVLVIFASLMSMDMCYQNSACHEFFVSLITRTFIFILFPFISIFLLSLVTYKMRDEIFAAWISFAVCWIPLSMLAILLTPADDGGSFSIPLKGPLALFCAVALLVISLVIIIYKHFTLKKGGMGK